MSAPARGVSGRTSARQLMAVALFAAGVAAAVEISFFDLDPIGAAALLAVVATLLAAAHRPEFGTLLTLALFADAVYFGTYGFTLPFGQLTPLDVVFLGWWLLTLLAAFWRARGILPRSPATLFLTGVYPALLLFYFCYSRIAFGAEMQEMLRAARPFLYVTLFVPLAFWLRAEGAIDRLIRMSLLVGLCAACCQFAIYTLGIDVQPYGLFYEWQVWRDSFEGFDRSNQPFFGLNLILAGGLVAMAMTEQARSRRCLWWACTGALFVSGLISFGRGLWAALAVSAAVPIAMTTRARRGRTLLGAASMAALVCGALAVTALASGVDVAGFAAAALDRAENGAESIRYLDGTFGDRYDNVNRALLVQHPWLGVGFFLALGSASDVDYADTGHNLYLDLALRMGVVGLGAFSALFVIFTRRCRFALSRDLPPARRAAVLGCLGAGAGHLAWSVSSSHMMNHRGMFEMALMMAVVEAIVLTTPCRSAGAGVSP